MEPFVWRGHKFTASKWNRNGLEASGPGWKAWVSKLNHGYYSNVSLDVQDGEGQDMSGTGLHATDPKASLDDAFADLEQNAAKVAAYFAALSGTSAA